MVAAKQAVLHLRHPVDVDVEYQNDDTVGVTFGLAGTRFPLEQQAEAVAPILARAKKLAGTWVVADTQEAAYQEWMEWCEDWVRDRLKQTYYEIWDVEWFTRVAAPHTPPTRSPAQLDKMARDICEEAWTDTKETRVIFREMSARFPQSVRPHWLFQDTPGQLSSRTSATRNLTAEEAAEAVHVTFVQGAQRNSEACRNYFCRLRQAAEQGSQPGPAA